MATTPNYGWTTPDDTDLVKDGALAIRTLGDEIDNTVYSNVGGMTLISTTTLTGATVSITSIPQTYKDLKLIFRNVRPATDNTNLRFRFNQDATANRHVTDTSGQGTVAFGATFATILDNLDNGASQTSLINLDIFDYTNTATWKFYRANGITPEATTATSVRFSNNLGIYNQTSAVTAFDVFMSSGNFTSGSLLLYGVK